MFACIKMLHKKETKIACDHVWWSRGEPVPVGSDVTGPARLTGEHDVWPRLARRTSVGSPG
jgi:hypothetical protein